jgi:hypothetical protein
MDGQSLLNFDLSSRAQRWVVKRYDKVSGIDEGLVIAKKRRHLLSNALGPDYRFDISTVKGLLGRSLSEFNVTDIESKALISHLSRLSDVDTSSGYMPGLLKIRFESVPAIGEGLLVIALNGKIYANNNIWFETDNNVEIVIPEHAFSDGINDLDIFFAIESDDASYRLQRFVIADDSSS